MCSRPKEIFDADFLALYLALGACAQYFTKLKNEIDLWHPPSEKFSVSELFFQRGVLVNSMLRSQSKPLIKSGNLELKKATRHRVHTSMQGKMYLCAAWGRHSRRVVLKVVCNNGFGGAFTGM